MLLRKRWRMTGIHMRAWLRRRGGPAVPPTVGGPERLRDARRGAVCGCLRHNAPHRPLLRPQHARYALRRVQGALCGGRHRDRGVEVGGFWVVHAARGAAVDHKLLPRDEAGGSGVGQEERHVGDVIAAPDAACELVCGSTLIERTTRTCPVPAVVVGAEAFAQVVGGVDPSGQNDVDSADARERGCLGVGQTEQACLGRCVRL